MNQRDRVLAAGAGVIIATFAVVWMIYGVRKAFDNRNLELTKAKEQLEKRDAEILKGKKAVAKLKQWEARSLSSDETRANSDYLAWLTELSRTKGMDVRPGPQMKKGTQSAPLFMSHSYEVSGEIESKRLIEFLHQFYNAGYLHNVTKLNAKGQIEKDKPALLVNMTVEALSLYAAPEEPNKEVPPADPPLKKEVPEYLHAILARNFFYPKNNPPRIANAGPQNGNPNLDVSFSLKASDPDKWDQGRHVFKLNSSDLPGATLSEKGDFRGRPTKVGTYFASVVVEDSAYPPLSHEEKIVINVKEPEVERAKPKSFGDDPARNAKITAIVGPTDDLQAWVTAPRGLGDQPKVLHLKVGDTIEIGSFLGVLRQVREREAEFEMKDGRTIVRRSGQQLVSADEQSGN